MLPRRIFILLFPILIAAAANKVRFTYDELASFRGKVMPLLDLIASGEGNYTSVNRGRAGDSKGDWPKRHLGKSITEMTIAELRAHQGGRNSDCWYEGKKGKANLFAVGRYQLIPCTLKFATEEIEDLDMETLYSPEVQDTFGVFLLLVKRPMVRDYLAGISNAHKEAGQELAKEFASIPIQYSNGRCRRGQSYYCGDKAGNKAYIALADVDKALKKTRRKMKRDGELQRLISQREGLRRKIQRWWSGLFNRNIETEPNKELEPIQEEVSSQEDDENGAPQVVPALEEKLDSEQTELLENQTTSEDDDAEDTGVEEIINPRITPIEE